MDAATIGFLALMVLVSGLIAYVADLLGRKLGKKRLTLGKLRPRHTAALMTVAAGMAISVLTIAIVMVLSQDVREFILRGNQAIREARQSLVTLQDVRRQLKATQQEYDKQQKLLATALQQQKDAAAEVKRLAGLVDGYKSQIAGLKATGERYRHLAGKYEANYKSAEAKIKSASAQLAGVKKDLASAQSQRKLNLERLNELDKRMTELDRTLITTESKLSETEAELKTKQGELDTLTKRVATLSEDLKKAQSDLAEASTDLDNTGIELDRKKIELDRVQGDLRQTQSMLQSLERGLVNTRIRPLILSYGQELARIQVEPGQTPDQVAAALDNVVAQSRRSAEQYGAKPSRQGGPVASIKDQLVNDKLVTAEEQRQAVVRAASGLQEDAVIIATAFWNVYEDEDVPLVVVAYRNPMVYRQGQIIAETRIDGNKEDGVILKQVSDFLSVKVKQKAMEDKMIPAVGRGSSFGEIALSDVIEVAREIKESRRQVRLVAVAKQDTRAADPLELDLRIR